MTMLTLTGCTHLPPFGPPQGQVYRAQVLTPRSDNQMPVQVFQIEKPVAQPSLRRRPTIPAGTPKTLSPRQAVKAAKLAATEKSNEFLFDRARHNFIYFDSSVYEVYFAPGFVTSLYLEAGEKLNDLYAGDTSRWQITETTVGSGKTLRTIILVKPHLPRLKTNFVITTNRRAYMIDAISTDTELYHTAVSWTYPSDSIGKLRPILSRNRRKRSKPEQTHVPTLSPVNFSYGYKISVIQGDEPDWMPKEVFSDGTKTYIRFPKNLGTMDAPPLFIVSNNETDTPALVDYRIQKNFYIVDLNISHAILKYGQPQTIVSIKHGSGS